jgi:hypothetical protein
VDPRAGLDDMEKRKFLPYRDSNSDPSIVQPVGSRYNDYAIPAHLRDVDKGKIENIVSNFDRIKPTPMQ